VSKRLHLHPPKRCLSRSRSLSKAEARASDKAERANATAAHFAGDLASSPSLPRTKSSGDVSWGSSVSKRSEQPGSDGLFEPPFVGQPRPLGPSWLATRAAAAVGKVLNLAIFSDEAEEVHVCLFQSEDLERGTPLAELVLDPEANRTGDIWHVAIPLLREDLFYAFRVTKGGEESGEDEYMLLDPYARAIGSRHRWGQLARQSSEGLPRSFGPCWAQHAAAVPRSSASSFDWEGDRPLGIPMSELVIYELHVRGFTAHESSKVKHPGTYAGLVEKLDYISDLGINAIELMPVHEFNELEYYEIKPANGVYRYNVWGYSTVGFFAPMSRYASCVLSEGLDKTADVVNEFKQMVKECHKRGIEVILDVVFNHTAEGNEQGPSLSFRGFSNRVYYMLAPKGEYYNYSGCGNTFNCNHPVVREFILDCLRYWVSEMHVDGFRFDLASIMTRNNSKWAAHPERPIDSTGVGNGNGNGSSSFSSSSSSPSFHWLDDPEQCTGTPLSDPPLLSSISTDPILSKAKLIAEAWDCDGLNQVGSFPHYGGRWSEWNGVFRDNVRQFIKGTDGLWSGAFAGALCGSPDVYAKAKPAESDWWGNHGGYRWRGTRGPSASINFVTAHDGFTLADLCSYNKKHNEANGEANKDGEQHNNSWNCGQEGPSADEGVRVLRNKQVRNFATALMVAQGIPMLVMGDEYGHSKGGNNNTYCHDGDINYFQWNVCEEQKGLVRFFKRLIHMRKENPLFRQRSFLDGEKVQWHGVKPFEPDWSETSRIVAFTLQDGKSSEVLYVAFNSGHKVELLELPELDDGGVWDILVDTSKPAPHDFLEVDDMLTEEELTTVKGQAEPYLQAGVYPLCPWSAVVLRQGGDGGGRSSLVAAPDFASTSTGISSPAENHPDDVAPSTGPSTKSKSARGKQKANSGNRAKPSVSEKLLKLEEENRKLKAILDAKTSQALK